MTATIAMDPNGSWNVYITTLLQWDVNRRGVKAVARDCKSPPDSVKKWASGLRRVPAAPVGEYLTECSDARRQFMRLLLAQKPEARIEILAALQERACRSR